MKIKKIIAAILAFILIAVVLFIANGMVGNPISKMLTNRAATKYIAENYSDLNLELEKAFYSFKDGRYHVKTSSTSSIDTHFPLSYSWRGELDYDGYENLVVSKWNTWRRIDDEYRKLIDSEIKGKLNFDERDFIYGELRVKDDDFSNLVIDKIYDVKELAISQGHINLHLEKDIPTIKIMTETLTKVKEITDKEEIPFYSIDINLYEPRREDDKQKELLTKKYLMVKEFLYSDIYLDGLAQRVEENIEATRRYYEEQDEEKKRETEKI